MQSNTLRPFTIASSLLGCVLTLTGCATATVGGTAARCEALVSENFSQTNISSAALDANRKDLPAFCRVQGQIAGEVGFEMRLPASTWNGKFAVTGCGGFCGSLVPEKTGYSNSMNEALKLGYAVIQTDSGHTAQSWETDWAIGNAPALELFAGEWMPLAVATGRGVIGSFYIDEPSRTYFTGCSNGGRLGLYAAQRYPNMFDGIAAGGGVFDLTGNSGVHGLWLLQSTRDENGKAVIDNTKLPLLSAHVLKQCDALDGVVDQTVSRPSLCKPDLSALQCPTNVAQEGDKGAAQSCFTPTEMAAIKRLYQGATLNGKQLFVGLPPGSEDRWPMWVVGTDDKPAWGEAAVEGYMRLNYEVPANIAFNAHDYDFAEALPTLQRTAAVVDAVNPDLSGFAESGGKLFYYQGLADPLILEGRVRQYHDDAAAIMGKAQLDNVARFMMVPGHGHCWALPSSAADDFNPLAVIDRWVESGEAPNEVVAKSFTSALTRKLCPYPKFAKLVGEDPTNAESYVCE